MTEYEEERDRAIEQFKAIKQGDSPYSHSAIVDRNFATNRPPIASQIQDSTAVAEWERPRAQQFTTHSIAGNETKGISAP